MKVYELKFLCPEGVTVEELTPIFDKASNRTKSLVVPLGVTVHSRPPERPVNRGFESTLMVAVNDESACYSMAGTVVRLSGLPLANIAEVSTGTLNFKGDVSTVEEFIESVNVSIGDDTFKIGDDEADEDQNDYFNVDI